MMCVWALLAIRYGIRVVGLCTEFYNITSNDPKYDEMTFPTLQVLNYGVASDDLVESMKTLESHSITQIMKTVATVN